MASQKPLIRIDRDGKLTALAEALDDARDLMDATGFNLVARAQRAFREQKRGSNLWGARMNPNVPGVVSDLNAGRNPQARRFVAGPALQDTGLLRRSITHRATARSVEVGTTVPYATIHQRGGKSLSSLSRSGRAKLAAWLRKNRDKGADLGWLFSKSKFTVRVRKRPFIGFDDEDLSDFREELSDWLGDRLDGAT